MENLASCSPHHRCPWTLLQFQQCTTMMTRTSLKGSGGKMSEQPSRIMKTYLVINSSPPYLQLWSTELYQARKVQTARKVQQTPHLRQECYQGGDNRRPEPVIPHMKEDHCWPKSDLNQTNIFIEIRPKSDLNVTKIDRNQTMA